MVRRRHVKSQGNAFRVLSSDSHMVVLEAIEPLGPSDRVFNVNLRCNAVLLSQFIPHQQRSYGKALV